MTTETFELRGLRVLHVLTGVTVGHNCSFEEVPADQRVYEFHLVKDSTSYKLKLYKTTGECYSGWTTASWGHGDLRIVDVFGPVTHVPNKGSNETVVIELDVEPGLKLPEDYQCEYFSWTYDGGDYYYPGGGISVNLDKFTGIGRGHDKPVVFIFRGPSNLCKSTLAQYTGLQRYETDNSDALPSNLMVDIVVIGNKYRHTVEQVKQCFSVPCNFILVDFSQR